MNIIETESVLGYPVCIGGVEPLLKDVLNWIKHGRTCRSLACMNPHSYSVARSNGDFADALTHANWLIPDGVGIVLASRILRGKLRERVTGSDIFEGLNGRLNKVGGSVFFLGATEETLSAIRKRMKLDYPNVKVAGTCSCPFKPAFSEQDTSAMLTAINMVAPDVLWVGMTSPKQDLWIYANRHRLNVKFAAGVGAVFDFYIGRVRRSHPIFQRLGLEWLPRLLQEPRRLWPRTFVSAPIFVWHVVRQKLRGRR